MTNTPNTQGMTPAERLRFYVTGAIERGEAEPILGRDDPAETADEYGARRAQAAASIRASVERDSWNAVGMRAEIGECGYPTREGSSWS